MNGSVLLVLICAAVLVVVTVLVIRSMMRGRLRQARMRAPQIGGLPPLPDTVGEPTIPATSGRYVGSTLAPGRLGRIAADEDSGGEAVLTRYPEGIMVKRSGSRPIWIPEESIIDLRAEGKMLTIRWRLPSGMEIETGFRGDDDQLGEAGSE